MRAWARVALQQSNQGRELSIPGSATQNPSQEGLRSVVRPCWIVTPPTQVHTDTHRHTPHNPLTLTIVHTHNASTRTHTPTPTHTYPHPHLNTHFYTTPPHLHHTLKNPTHSHIYTHTHTPHTHISHTLEHTHKENG